MISLKKHTATHTLYIAAVLMVTSCGPSTEDKLASYRSQIAGYDCKALDTELRFSQEMIAKLTEADSKYDPLQDFATTTLTLGTDLIPDGNSPSTSHNYNCRIRLLQEKQNIVTQNHLGRCPHAG